MASGRGYQLVQTTVKLDNEDERRYTLVIPGFHRNTVEWWGQVKKRGVVRDGFVARKNPAMWTDDERRNCGDFVPISCTRDVVHISMLEVPHNSTNTAYTQWWAILS